MHSKAPGQGPGPRRPLATPPGRFAPLSPPGPPGPPGPRRALAPPPGRFAPHPGRRLAHQVAHQVAPGPGAPGRAPGRSLRACPRVTCACPRVTRTQARVRVPARARARVRVPACARARVCACPRVRVPACVRACVRARACGRVRTRPGAARPHALVREAKNHFKRNWNFDLISTILVRKHARVRPQNQKVKNETPSNDLLPASEHGPEIFQPERPNARHAALPRHPRGPAPPYGLHANPHCPFYGFVFRNIFIIIFIIFLFFFSPFYD